jgi:HAD superfamily hydrolase (TIGR01509 family)
MLRAVIFDVDGTLAETEREGHRVAFNRAFERLGLPDRWDEKLYGVLLLVAGGKERLAHYFDTYRSLPAAERDRLAAEVHRLKNEIFVQMVEGATIPARPGVPRLLDELAVEGLSVAIATTGSREWVTPLLRGALGRERLARFSVIMTGEDTARKKPDPQVYALAVRRLGCRPDEALAVEDSENGVRAAKAASLACLVVRSFYSERDDLTGADLVVDAVGDETTPLTVLFNPHGVPVGERITAATLRGLHRVTTGYRAPPHPTLSPTGGEGKGGGERSSSP